MSEWIAHSKDLFMQSLTEVGQNHQHALDLQTQHQHFTANCMVSFLYPCWSSRGGISHRDTFGDLNADGNM